MAKIETTFTFEYEYIPTPDAAERIVQAWDIIFALILDDYRSEQEQEGEDTYLGSEPC